LPPVSGFCHSISSYPSVTWITCCAAADYSMPNPSHPGLLLCIYLINYRLLFYFMFQTFDESLSTDHNHSSQTELLFTFTFRVPKALNSLSKWTFGGKTKST
jgi:hypothetical protein